ncbi:MAG: helix-turn-helix transcriptional regulator [Bacteroidales bacterium]|nr:helix-turn-helix transcriptional regulator [Bacteroidales bacterium]
MNGNYFLFTFVILIFIEMRERILEFLKAENKSSAQFAEEIGVQPSGISHILSGRNNPSLDFVLKMLEKYHFLSTEWLLFGRGSMYKDSRMQTLFEEIKTSERDTELSMFDNDDPARVKENVIPEKDQTGSVRQKSVQTGSGSLSRIIWFFEDNSFEEYFPR